MNEEEKNEEEKTVEHLVISGGGFGGFFLYKEIRNSNLRGEWNIKNIKSIYGVSIGSVIGTIIALKYDWNVIDDYIINCSLQKLIKLDKLNLSNFFYKYGIIDQSVFIDFMRPFFLGASVEIDIDVSMYDFYKKTGISLYFYCTEVLEYKKIEMSPFATPDLSVIDAIYRSCSIPFIFIPHRGICKNTLDMSFTPIYIDGYLTVNYPSKECIKECIDEEKILGFTIKKNENGVKNLLDLVNLIIFGIGNSIIYNLKKEYIVDYSYFTNFNNIYLYFTSSKTRRILLDNYINS